MFFCLFIFSFTFPKRDLSRQMQKNKMSVSTSARYLWGGIWLEIGKKWHANWDCKQWEKVTFLYRDKSTPTVANVTHEVERQIVLFARVLQKLSSSSSSSSCSPSDREVENFDWVPESKTIILKFLNGVRWRQGRWSSGGTLLVMVFMKQISLVLLFFLLLFFVTENDLNYLTHHSVVWDEKRYKKWEESRL